MGPPQGPVVDALSHVNNLTRRCNHWRIRLGPRTPCQVIRGADAHGVRLRGLS